MVQTVPNFACELLMLETLQQNIGSVDIGKHVQYRDQTRVPTRLPIKKDQLLDLQKLRPASLAHRIYSKQNSRAQAARQDGSVPPWPDRRSSLQSSRALSQLRPTPVFKPVIGRGMGQVQIVVAVSGGVGLCLTRLRCSIAFRRSSGANRETRMIHLITLRIAQHIPPAPDRFYVILAIRCDA